jgi:uncharacterized protein YqjF (DUF2071 family)
VARTFLTAEWRDLLMVNYVVDPTILQPYVPQGTELDFWNGQTFVSIVGFRFLRTRVLCMPIPFHRNFDEVNLRFYVRRQCNGEWLKGVVFVKEIVPKWAVATVARAVYNENYVRLPMRSTVQVPGHVSYEWKHDGEWSSVAAHVAGESYQPSPDSEETFITEHYWGYTRQRDGGTVEYQVEHQPWKVYRCESAMLKCRVAELYGDAFIDTLSKAPSSAFLADGSAVVVRRGVRCA